MNNAERRIPVQYAKRVVGRKMYGGQSTFIPVKVNMSRRYARHLRQRHPVHSRQLIRCFCEPDTRWPLACRSGRLLNYSTGWLYAVLYFLLIIGVQLLLCGHPV